MWLVLSVSRVENAVDMFAFNFLGKPSSIIENNPDWAPSQKLGYDCNKVTGSSQEIGGIIERKNLERVEKRRRSEGAMELSKATDGRD